MMRREPAETIPDFKSLATDASNLMIAGKSHRAKNEIFESAVAWVKAGRTLAELASKLLHNDYVPEAAQEILHAAACFLEAGDHRPAHEQLDRFEKLPQLASILQDDEYLRSEHAVIMKWCRRVGRELENALSEMREQMQGPRGAHRLKPTWIDGTLRKIPGLFEVHWFASQKVWDRGEKSGNVTDKQRAIEHHRLCIHLRPDRLGLRLVLVMRLSEVGDFPEAIRTSSETVASFQNDAYAHWFAGWARLHFVTRHRGPKNLLPQAVDHFERAVELATQLSEPQLVVAKCSIAWALGRMGCERDAEDRLSRTIREHASAEVARLALKAPPRKRAAVFLAHIGSVMNRAWPDVVSPESVYAGAA